MAKIEKLPDLTKEIQEAASAKEAASALKELETKKGRGEVKKGEEDIFHKLASIPKWIHGKLRGPEASQIYQTFKLAGTDYIVQDKRDAPKEREGRLTPADESKMPLEDLIVRRGKLVAALEREYENYLADPGMQIRGPEVKTASWRLLEWLTPFYKLLVARFEGGQKVAKSSTDGQAHFLRKTVGEWRAFFKHFEHRSVKRRIAKSGVQEGIFRGYIKTDGRATLISDLRTATNVWEKFVRIQSDPGLMASLATSLLPGTRIDKGLLQRITLGEDLIVLAIKEGNPESIWQEAPTRGKFLERAVSEEKTAQHLGVELGTPVLERAQEQKETRIKKRRGLFGSLWGEEEPGADTTFVPWFQWLRQERQGPIRWYVAISLGTILVILGISLWFLIRGL